MNEVKDKAIKTLREILKMIFLQCQNPVYVSTDSGLF